MLSAVVQVFQNDKQYQCDPVQKVGSCCMRQNGSRLLWYIAGIECPRGKRQLPGGQVIEADPYGEEALLFTKEMCLQREVSQCQVLGQQMCLNRQLTAVY